MLAQPFGRGGHEEFSQREEIQRTGAPVVLPLVAWEYSASIFMEEGALAVLLEAMGMLLTSHAEQEATILCHACQAITGLLQSDYGGQQAGGISILVQVLDTYGSSSIDWDEIVTLACYMIAIMAIERDSQGNSCQA